MDFQLSDIDTMAGVVWCYVARERERDIVAARKTLSETPWRTAGGGQCLGQSLIERAECSVMHQRHA